MKPLTRLRLVPAVGTIIAASLLFVGIWQFRRKESPVVYDKDSLAKLRGATHRQSIATAHPETKTEKDFDASYAASLEIERRMNYIARHIARDQTFNYDTWFHIINDQLEGKYKQHALMELTKRVITSAPSDLWKLLHAVEAGLLREEVALTAAASIGITDLPKLAEWAVQELHAEELHTVAGTIAERSGDPALVLKMRSRLPEMWEREQLLSAYSRSQKALEYPKEALDGMASLPDFEYASVARDIGARLASKGRLDALGRFVDVAAADPRVKSDVFLRQLGKQLAEDEPSRRWTWIVQRPDSQRDGLIGGFLSQWSRDNLESASGWAAKLPADGNRDLVALHLANSLNNMGEVDAAKTWIASIRDATVRSRAPSNLDK